MSEKKKSNKALGPIKCWVIHKQQQKRSAVGQLITSFLRQFFDI
jgi:hypothetical protein